MEHDYFPDRPGVFDASHTYTDGPALTSTASVQWQHPLGDVVSALAGAGLRIAFLHEHPTLLFRRFDGMERCGAGEFRPAGRPRLPLMYSIRAHKDA